MFGKFSRRAKARSRFLAETPTFSRFPEAARDLIADRMTDVRIRPGEMLMRQGDPGDRMLILIGGRAEVRVHDAEGRTHVLATPGEGAVLGEMALLTDEPRSADVVSTSAAKALALSAGDFHALVKEYPDLAVVLTHLVADRLGQSDRDGLGGKVLEGYRIKQRLGVGATAIVYDAVEVATGREVALKMLSHRLVFDPKAIEKFHREIRFLERMDDPNIASVYGHFAAFGTWFMVLERVEGCTLHDVVQRHAPLADSQTRAITGQLSRALAHVHAVEIVHRDLKPANVMIAAAGDLKLTDFGVSQPAPTAESAELMGDEFLSGTPMYMAPEQFITPEVDHRADLYALGYLVHEMATGRPVIEAAGLGELVRRKRELGIPDRQAVRADLPDDLYRVLVETLAAEKDDRTLDLATLGPWAEPVDPALTA